MLRRKKAEGISMPCFSLSISVSLARLNLYEGTLIKRIYREEQPCEIEPFLLNLDEKLWQLFIFVSGLPSHPSSFPLHLFSFLLRVCDRAIFASLFFFFTFSCVVNLLQEYRNIPCLTLKCQSTQLNLSHTDLALQWQKFKWLNSYMDYFYDNVMTLLCCFCHFWSLTDSVLIHFKYIEKSNYSFKYWYSSNIHFLCSAKERK